MAVQKSADCPSLSSKASCKAQSTSSDEAPSSEENPTESNSTIEKNKTMWWQNTRRRCKKHSLAKKIRFRRKR